MMSISGYIRVV